MNEAEVFAKAIEKDCSKIILQFKDDDHNIDAVVRTMMGFRRPDGIGEAFQVAISKIPLVEAVEEDKTEVEKNSEAEIQAEL